MTAATKRAPRRKRAPKKEAPHALRLTEKMVTDLAQYLLSGCHLVDAATLVDISERTLRNYRVRGRAEAQRIEEEGGTPIPSEALYLKLWQETQTSRTKRKVRALTTVQDLMSDPDPHVKLKAATWYLERGWPDEFGRRTRIEENEPRGDNGDTTDPEKQRREAFAALDELTERRSRKTGS